MAVKEYWYKDATYTSSVDEEGNVNITFTFPNTYEGETIITTQLYVADEDGNLESNIIAELLMCYIDRDLVESLNEALNK